MRNWEHMPNLMPTQASGTVPIDATAIFILQPPLLDRETASKPTAMIGWYMYIYKYTTVDIIAQVRQECKCLVERGFEAEQRKKINPGTWTLNLNKNDVS
jgi:hypothetical protein